MRAAESEWPYDVSQFAVKPPDKCYTDRGSSALHYAHVPPTSYYIRHAILGRPIAFGISAFSGLESDQAAATGIVPMPVPDDSPAGGHAICLVGYYDSKRVFSFRNCGEKAGAIKPTAFFLDAYILDPNLANDLGVILTES
ncbi:MAG TPA: hypothetical protein VEV37_12350 [Bryobacteraceae bacterium]|nr:hypothetical protein [Bryobacteraceae bacterium]